MSSVQPQSLICGQKAIASWSPFPAGLIPLRSCTYCMKFLCTGRLRLICAHVHHGFRKESDQEAEMVRELAERLGLPLETAFIDIPAYMEESGKGGQEVAREKRYEFLPQTAHTMRAP